jgi:heme exporter protein B
MLPVIVYPLLIPLLIAAIERTKALFGTQPLDASQFFWGKMLVVFDIVFTALAILLADTILVN